MRKLLSIAICVMAVTLNLTAQLRVDSLGNVKVDSKLGVGGEPTNSATVNVTQTKSSMGTYYGVKSTFNCSTQQRTSYMAIAGIMHTDTTLSKMPQLLPRFFRAGILGTTNLGVGVYGACNTISAPLYFNGSYAGYFNGDVKVVGTLTATTVTTTSDYRLKKDILELSNMSGIIQQLNPVSYHLRQDTANFSYSENSQEIRNLHYGLVAQEVQKVLPDIVYENQDGYLSINYTELVPLLIQSVKELKAENEKQNKIIESLQSQLNKQSNNPSKVKGKSGKSDEIEAKLYQNQPNPFSQATEIKYSLPLTTQSATLNIYDMSGVQQRSYPISQFGENSLTITAKDLTAGMYLYSLIADGQVIDTKRMILTK